MLKVINKEIVKKESIKFDIYVPINIEFEVENISEEPIIYWRTGNFIDSLIEIGVGKYKKEQRIKTLLFLLSLIRIILGLSFLLWRSV